MAEATANSLPDTGAEDTGFKSASLASAGTRTMELGAKSIELLGAGIAKTSTSVIQPLLTTVLGANPLTAAVGGGVEGLGKLIGAGGKKISNFIQNKQQTDNSSVQQTDNSSVQQTDNSSVQQTDNSRATQITGPVNQQSTIAQQPSSGDSDPVSPLPTMLHPDMRRASRMPMVIRNAAMLTRAVQKRVGESDETKDKSEDQTDSVLQAQDESTIRIINALDNQTTMSLEKQEELQPTFLERRQDVEMGKKALEEQKRTNKLLTEGNKQKAKDAKEGSGGFLSGILDNITTVIGGGLIGFFGSGGTLMDMFSKVGGLFSKLAGVLKPFLALAKKFFVITFIISTIEGLIPAFEVFQEGGSIFEILMAGIEGFAASMIKILTFGFLDLEMLQLAATDGIEWVVDKFGLLWDGIVGLTDKLFKFMTFGFGDLESTMGLVKKVLFGVFDTIKFAFSNFINLIKFNFGFIMDVLTGNFSGVVDRLKTMFGFFVGGFKWIGEKVLGFFGRLGGIVAKAFEFSPIMIAFDLIKKAFGFLPKVAQKLFDGIQGMVRKIPVFGNKLADTLFGTKEEQEQKKQEKAEQEARVKEANETAAEVLAVDAEKADGSTDLTLADIDRSREFQGRVNRSNQTEERPRRVSENIELTSRRRSGTLLTESEADARQLDQPKRDRTEQISDKRSQELIAGVEANNAALLDQVNMNQRANQRATQTEDLSAQVREAQQAQQQQREQNTLNNMNQINNNQTTVTNPTKLPPRAEDFTAGAINRDQDY